MTTKFIVVQPHILNFACSMDIVSICTCKCSCIVYTLVQGIQIEQLLTVIEAVHGMHAHANEVLEVNLYKLLICSCIPCIITQFSITKY